MAPRISTTRTIDAILAERQGGKTYRGICRKYGLPERDAATLCNIVLGKPVSASNEGRICGALGLRSPRRKLHRPVASAEDEARRQALGVTWRDVIAAGLDALESQEEHEHNHD